MASTRVQKIKAVVLAVAPSLFTVGNQLQFDLTKAAVPADKMVTGIWLDVYADLRIQNTNGALVIANDEFLGNVYAALIQNLTFNMPNQPGNLKQLFDGPVTGATLNEVYHREMGILPEAPGLLPGYGEVTPSARSVVTPAALESSAYIRLRVPLLIGRQRGAGDSFAFSSNQLKDAVLGWTVGSLQFSDQSNVPKTCNFLPGTAVAGAGGTSLQVVIEYDDIPADQAKLHGSPIHIVTRAIGGSVADFVISQETGVLTLCGAMYRPTLTDDSVAFLEQSIHTSTGAPLPSDAQTNALTFSYDGVQPSDGYARPFGSFAGIDRMTALGKLGSAPEMITPADRSVASGIAAPVNRYNQSGVPFVWCNPLDILSTATTAQIGFNQRGSFLSGSLADSATYVTYAYVCPVPSPGDGAGALAPQTKAAQSSLYARLQSFMAKVWG